MGINGFGRIGRNVFRAAQESDADIEIVAVNDITDAGTLAHLLKYDSVRAARARRGADGSLAVDGREVKVLAEKDPALPWGDLGAEVVIESTGLFTKRDDAAKHLEAGARKVIISAPATEPDATVALGVNFDEVYDPDNHHVISNASCTTNCLAPVAKVLHETIGIDRGLMTIHAYTADQRLQDAPHRDSGAPARRRSTSCPRRPARPRRSASWSASCRASCTASRSARRADRSVVDLTVQASRETSVDEINDAFRCAPSGPLAGILQYTDDPIVSSDIVKSPFSSIFDSGLTSVLEGTMKVVAWYDNEWGTRTAAWSSQRCRCARLTTWTSRESVLVRVDFNVPLDEDRNITDDSRIRAALPTLNELREKGAWAAGGAPRRPKDREPEFSLQPAAERLSELLGTDVQLADSLDDVPDASRGCRERPRGGETKNDPELAKRYAALADAYVNDAFGAAHRRTPPRRRWRTCSRAPPAGCSSARCRRRGILEDLQTPLVVVGGAKVTDKIGVLDAFLERADEILIGGAMRFFKAPLGRRLAVRGGGHRARGARADGGPRQAAAPG